MARVFGTRIKESARMSSSSKHYMRWPLVIFAVALMSTAAFAWQLWQTVQAKDQERFERRAAIAQNSLRDHISTCITLLRGAAGLFAGSDDVRREELRAYVERLELERYPGVLGIGWSLRIPASAKNNVITATRKQWSSSFDIWPPGERPEYHAVLYLEALDQLNQAAIGYDMFTQPIRRAAMERARDIGSAAASAKLMLLYEIDKQRQPSFLIYVPVYRGGAVPETVAERRAKLVGFLYSPYHAGRLMSNILSAEEWDPYLNYRIFDGTEVNPDALLYQSDTEDVELAPRFTKTAMMDVAGRSWTIVFASTPAFERATEERLPLIVLASGVLISFMLAGGAWWQARARVAAEQSANALRESQRELMEQREWLQTTFASMGDALITTDKAGIVTYLNPVAVTLTGWALTEAQGKPLESVFHIINEKTRAAAENPVVKVLRGGKMIGLANHTLLVDKDGKERPIDDSAAPILDQQGRINGVVLIFHDVTRQRQAERALERSEAHYRRLFETAGDGVFLLNMETGRIVDANPNMAKLAGPRSELLGKQLWEIGLFPDADANRAAFREFKEKDYIRYERLPLVSPDGNRRDVELVCSAYGAGDNQVMQCNVRDITERKRMEDTLRESEELYRSLTEISPQGVWMTEPDGVLLYINQYWIEYSGMSLEQCAAEGWMQQVHPDDRERVSESWQHALVAGTAYEVEARFRRAADGQYRWHLVRGVPVCDDDGRIEKWLGVVVDIHQRTLAEAAMAQLGAIVESSDDAIIGIDLDGMITSWNAGAERLYGYNAPEVIGKPISILIPPGHMDEELAFLEKLRGGVGIAHYETERMRKGGRVLQVALTISPIKNRAGRVIGSSKVARDISERKHAERERAELLMREQALRTQAEAASRAKDDFLATLSHELRTPLNAILGWVQTLNSGKTDKETRVRAMQAIEQSAWAQAKLIGDLLNVSDIIAGRLRLDVKPLNLPSVIGEAVESLLPAIEAKEIDFATRFDPAAESFNGDAARIQQIIWNLVSNAVKFTPRRGQVRLALTRYESHIEITVEDNGDGISATFLPHVFHRFRQADSSSKRKHGGLGLGLAIVRHLVELHGGTVEAESPGAGQGARFTVRLPVRVLTPVEQMVQTEQPPPVATIPVTRLRRLDGLRILSVDDDHTSREMLQVALQRAGAEVISAASAAEALKLFQRLRPDVLISDIGLPDEDGYDLLRAVRALPLEAGGATPAIALSGYVSAQDRLATETIGYQAFVSKPVNLTELIDAIIRLSHGPRQPMTGEYPQQEKAPS
jgi:PAS domain S-box-containing protein